ncbi:histidine kinase N-terminal 7TM domain-containing protein [Haloarchaeobius sp. HME9146]|uniref:histidine kinase N-terminal 7TM domain-containing protein n=1 Tax=Haloarchaeobius sp. HME9146 TaxID=2978732 RepID=UPI0021C02E7E|nr:histidine kinase N-terminal 7TM domain-containing protein [Haloarchaeobius sp. HME9146]MCT9097985.1 helix-turn-helix domain-containing protein [Haloarchaeobius sp. HME9146]
MVGVVPALHVTLLGVSMLLSGWLAVVGWRVKERPAAKPFVGMMVSTGVWSGGYAVALLTDAPQLRFFWEQFQWFGIAFAPVFVLLFFAEYTGFDELANPSILAGLLIVPGVTLLLVWTSPWHPLIWMDTDYNVVYSLTIAEQDVGPWYWVHLLYTYLLVGGGTFLLLFAIRRTGDLFSMPTALVFVGVAAPLIANLLSVLGYAPFRGFDMTPYAFSITGLAFAAAISGEDLFERSPAVLQLGRYSVLSNIHDAVVITDRDGAVVTANEEAERVFNKPTGMVGNSIDDLLPTVPEPGAEQSLQTIGDREFEVAAATVEDAEERPVGVAYTLHDVTERERNLRELERRQTELASQRAELLELDAINTAIRGVLQILVSARTAEDLLDGATSRLATSDWYTDAYVDADRPTEGRPEDPSVTTDSGDDGPVVAARLPLPFGTTTYGTLVVETQREDAFGDRELATLEELAQSIGMALNAIETRQTLLADTVVELTYQFPASSSVLARVSADCDCRLTVNGTVPVALDDLLLYVTVEEGDVASVVAALENATEVDEIRQVPNRDTLELRLHDGSPLPIVMARGANVHDATAANGTLELVVETGSGNDVRALTDALSEAVGTVSLLAKQERSPATEPATTQFEADLTGRQEEAVAAAYNAGYFEWPRDSTAEEVAEAMDIAPSTFHSHLRKAQGKILTEYVESAADTETDTLEPR